LSKNSIPILFAIKVICPTIIDRRPIMDINLSSIEYISQKETYKTITASLTAFCNCEHNKLY